MRKENDLHEEQFTMLNYTKPTLNTSDDGNEIMEESKPLRPTTQQGDGLLADSANLSHIHPDMLSKANAFFSSVTLKLPDCQCALIHVSQYQQHAVPQPPPPSKRHFRSSNCYEVELDVRSWLDLLNTSKGKRSRLTRYTIIHLVQAPHEICYAIPWLLELFYITQYAYLFLFFIRESLVLR